MGQLYTPCDACKFCTKCDTAPAFSSFPIGAELRIGLSACPAAYSCFGPTAAPTNLVVSRQPDLICRLLMPATSAESAAPVVSANSRCENK